MTESPPTSTDVTTADSTAESSEAAVDDDSATDARAAVDGDTTADRERDEPTPPQRNDLPTSAEATASDLIEAEEGVRNSELEATVRFDWGKRQQALYALVSLNPDWRPVLLAAVDDGATPEVARAITANLRARDRLDSLVTRSRLADQLPAWSITAPRPPAELLGHYREAEDQTGIDWAYLAAINLVETRMGRIAGLSTAGAVGPMQFLPTTWAECCEGDPTVDRDAIIGAAVYLVDRGGPDNMDRALYGYNPSDDYVEAIKAYASVLQADEAAYWGYHAWDVYFRSAEGLLVLPIGYEQQTSIPVTEWLAENPDALFDNPVD